MQHSNHPPTYVGGYVGATASVPRSCEPTPRNCTSASDVSCHLGAGCHLGAAAGCRLRAAALPRDPASEGHLPRDTGDLPRHTLPPTPYLLPTARRAYLLPTLSRPPSRHQTEDGKTANTARPLPPPSHARALRRTRSATEVSIKEART